MIEEENIYNPYNEKNIEITEYDVNKILLQYNVSYSIHNFELFKRAFVHSSYVLNELNDDIQLALKPYNCLDLKNKSNERLEFLGDGVLEMITKFYLYKRFPEEEEEDSF